MFYFITKKITKCILAAIKCSCQKCDIFHIRIKETPKFSIISHNKINKAAIFAVLGISPISHFSPYSSVWISSAAFIRKSLPCSMTSTCQGLLRSVSRVWRTTTFMMSLRQRYFTFKAIYLHILIMYIICNILLTLLYLYYH